MIPRSEKRTTRLRVVAKAPAEIINIPTAIRIARRQKKYHTRSQGISHTLIVPKTVSFFIGAIVGLHGALAAPAYPWGSKGHEIVAAIAETHLTDTARKRIKELLPQGTTLAEASTWPDKAGRQIPDMDPYHFINFPKEANTYDQQRDCKLRNCIIEAIAWC